MLDVRCSWFPETYSGVGFSWAKTATLFEALVSRQPSKSWYLKVDADAIVRPPHLLAFLGALEQRQRGAQVATYVGNHMTVTRCAAGRVGFCRTKSFACRGNMVLDGHGTVNLRDTPAWLKLARELNSADGVDGQRCATNVKALCACLCATNPAT